jgi:hypothetical protein
MTSDELRFFFIPETFAAAARANNDDSKVHGKTKFNASLAPTTRNMQRRTPKMLTFSFMAKLMFGQQGKFVFHA